VVLALGRFFSASCVTWSRWASLVRRYDGRRVDARFLVLLSRTGMGTKEQKVVQFIPVSQHTRQDKFVVGYILLKETSNVWYHTTTNTTRGKENRIRKIKLYRFLLFAYFFLIFAISSSLLRLISISIRFSAHFQHFISYRKKQGHQERVI